MVKVVVIGRRSDILPFKAVGAELIEVEASNGAGDALRSFRDSSEPLMVLITEDFVSACPNEVSTFREIKKNVLLPIPSLSGIQGIRLNEMRSFVTRSLGVDLLAKGNTKKNNHIER
jgi:vacuolar-type H+-ATPase subunit F/Vma7